MLPINCKLPRPSTVCLLTTLCLAAWFAFGRPIPQPQPAHAAVQAATSARVPAGKPASRIKPIAEAQLGERTVGKNPLREQVETVEPDPQTWRKISLQMSKDKGLKLWVELLRPLDWLAEYDAEPGRTIFLDLKEMGAVGDAEVTAIEPCPPIQPGKGAVITGKFIHESDGKNVVLLRIEGQDEPTGVTTNHPYWSEDRQDYIPVGELREGELLDTEFGHRRVVSVTPKLDYKGLLYNLETTEHVYRMGMLGTLVHNSCEQLRQLGELRRSLGPGKKAYTLAKLEMAGQEFFGISASGVAAKLKAVNPISMTHAEADVFSQAAQRGITASEATLFIDRHMCRACGDLQGVRNMARNLGIKKLYIFEELASGVSVRLIEP